MTPSPLGESDIHWQVKGVNHEVFRLPKVGYLANA